MQYYAITNAQGVTTYGQGPAPAGAEVLDETSFASRLASSVAATATYAVSPAQLAAYADAQLSRALSSGITGDVGPAGSPLVVSADTSADGKANILGLLAAYQNGFKAAADTTAWYQTSGVVQLTQAQLLIVARAVLAHTDAAYSAWQRTVAGIDASPPTVTNYAQVEAAFASLTA